MFFIVRCWEKIIMTIEKEKMLAGLAFRTGDAELMENKKNARILAEKYNHSSEEDLSRCWC